MYLIDFGYLEAVHDRVLTTANLGSMGVPFRPHLHFYIFNPTRLSKLPSLESCGKGAYFSN